MQSSVLERNNMPCQVWIVFFKSLLSLYKLFCLIGKVYKVLDKTVWTPNQAAQIFRLLLTSLAILSKSPNLSGFQDPFNKTWELSYIGSQPWLFIWIIWKALKRTTNFWAQPSKNWIWILNGETQASVYFKPQTWLHCILRIDNCWDKWSLKELKFLPHLKLLIQWHLMSMYCVCYAFC